MFRHSFYGACFCVLQGESGLEGDSGPPGPDGVKVNLTLMAHFGSHTHLCALRLP